MMNDLPYWLKNLNLRFREEDEGSSNSDGQEDEGDNEDEDGEESNEGEAGSSSSDGEEDPAKRLEALEKALADERKLRRKIERDAKRNARKATSEQKNTDDAELQKQLETFQQRSTRLAEGFLRREVDSAILDEARKQGFIDPTDALLDDIRREVDADQDEDDPSEIDIDTSSVVDAVKDLARRKKHLVGRGLPGEPSGGKFRKKGSSDDKSTQQGLQETYPSLR